MKVRREMALKANHDAFFLSSGKIILQQFRVASDT